MMIPSRFRFDADSMGNIILQVREPTGEYRGYPRPPQAQYHWRNARLTDFGLDLDSGLLVLDEDAA